MAATDKPYTRWWWFSGPIRPDEIRYQLDWLKRSGFGGVEIAWVYPQDGAAPGPRWLSPEWAAIVAFTKSYATQVGLACDFTFGTSWPFGGSFVEENNASRTFSGLSAQRLEKSWELPVEGYLINHLDHTALERYAGVMGAGLDESLRGEPSALFCDSWEVLADGLWTDGFGDAFQKRYGYDIAEYMPALREHPAERYDYRKLISEYVLNEFYRPLTEICHRLGATSRVQCHGAPTDLLAAYAAVDIPETEAILFDPEFAVIAASAAALTGKTVVSAESFTCMYGWMPRPGPGPHQGDEQVGDLKMLADALFAHGVNQIVWHGMPYNPPGGTNRFYASTHVGPDSPFADQIPAFNAYMAKVSNVMRLGQTYSDIAVYLPLEDVWMLDELPEALRKPSAQYHWELQYARLPARLKGYRPLWISTPFLKSANYEDGLVRCGATSFRAIYVDVEWLDREALDELLRLARQGTPICMSGRPAEPGRNKSSTYPAAYRALRDRRNVSDDVAEVVASPRLVRGNDMPDYWCRRDGDAHYFFFAHPDARHLRYPLEYGQYQQLQATQRDVEIYVPGRRVHVTLEFAPYQSILLRIAPEGHVEYMDATFDPETHS